MKKIHAWYAVFVIATILTSWYINGLVIDLIGDNILDPRRHFNVWEFVWSLVFIAVIIISLWQIKKLRPASNKMRSTKNT